MLSCLVIRYFAVMVERKYNPDLADTPIAIVSTNARPKVIATSDIPKQAGVTPNLTIKQAQVLCPHIEIIRANHEAYEQASHEIAELMLHLTHKVEVEYQATTTAWYVEATSIEELRALQGAIKSYLGVSPTIGIGANKFVARVASASNFQDKALQVSGGDEKQFLAPFPVSLLPLDKDMKRRLPLLGIETLGQYARLPKGSVLEQFGKHGRWLHDIANGKDIRPIHSYQPKPKLHQTYQVDEAIEDYQIIKAVLQKLVALLIHQLNQREAGHLVLRLRLENNTIIEHHLQPPDAIASADVLSRHLETLLYRQPIPVGVTSLSINLLDLQERIPTQLSMFADDSNQQSVFDVIPRWKQSYQDVAFVQISMSDTPEIYIPEQQYQLVGA